MRTYLIAMLGATALATRLSVRPLHPPITVEQGNFDAGWWNLHNDDRFNFECLGWNETNWEDDSAELPASEYMSWADLKVADIAQCAERLGYTEFEWDNDGEHEAIEKVFN